MATHWIALLAISCIVFSVKASKIVNALKPTIDDYFVPRQDMQDIVNPPSYDDYSDMVK